MAGSSRPFETILISCRSRAMYMYNEMDNYQIVKFHREDKIHGLRRGSAES